MAKSIFIYIITNYIFSRQRFPVMLFLRHIQVTSLLICNHRLCVSGIIYFFFSNFDKFHHSSLLNKIPPCPISVNPPQVSFWPFMNHL